MPVVQAMGLPVEPLGVLLALDTIPDVFATVGNVTGWYAAADKAPWSPPNWLFGPVWTVLYTAMAVAAWLVWRSDSPSRGPSLVVYGVQLALNLVGLQQTPSGAVDGPPRT